MFVVGLDGADAELVETWMDDGTLPALRSLRDRGAWNRLTSVADHFAASGWPCVTYGTNPARSNVFSSFPLTGEGLNVTTLRTRINPDRPFVAYAPPPGLRSVLVDLPKSRVDPDLDAVQLVAWGAHAAEGGPDSKPAELMDEILRAVGPYPLKPLEEDNTAQDDDYYLYLRAKLLDAVDRRCALLSHLLRRYRDWDVFVSVWAEPHSVGHRFWHFMDRNHPWHRAEAPAALQSAVREVYAAADAAIGRLLAELPDEVTVLVLSVHGMEPNNNGQEVVARLLERWFAPANGGSISTGGLLADGAALLRGLLPGPLRDTVKQWLPDSLRYGARMQVMKSIYASTKWTQMRAFCLPTDDCGYVRINLKGRDTPGLVEPGAEYEALLAEIEAELRQLRNLDFDAPVIARIARPQEIYDGPFKALLPDLTLYWNATHPVRGVRSERFGELLDTNKLSKHRSGIHSDRAFLLGAGPGVRAGARIRDGHILDVAPTILAMVGAPQPEHLCGRVLHELLEPGEGQRTA